jgi:hypothetical protein
VNPSIGMARQRTDGCLAISLTAIVFAGCYSPYIRTPNFAHPGTAEQQRADAERFDPYPDPDAGPAVLGGRPPGFQRPLTDTEWGRRFAAPPGGLQTAPVVTMPVAPVVTNPFAPAPAPMMQPTYAPVLPSPTTPSQIQPRNPY